MVDHGVDVALQDQTHDLHVVGRDPHQGAVELRGVGGLHDRDAGRVEVVEHTGGGIEAVHRRDGSDLPLHRDRRVDGQRLPVEPGADPDPVPVGRLVEGLLQNREVRFCALTAVVVDDDDAPRPRRARRCGHGAGGEDESAGQGDDAPGPRAVAAHGRTAISSAVMPPSGAVSP